MLTPPLQLLTSYLTTNPQIRHITLASGLVGLTIVPYTLLLMTPINVELDALDSKNGLDGKDIESAEAKRCLQLFDKWRFHHYVREGIYGIVWGLVAWAVLSEKQL